MAFARREVNDELYQFMLQQRQRIRETLKHRGLRYRNRLKKLRGELEDRGLSLERRGHTFGGISSLDRSYGQDLVDGEGEEE